MENEEAEKIRNAFAKALRGLRKAKGLSQEKLGFETGLSMRFISLLETGKRQPSLTTMVSLARALGVTLVDLVAQIET